MGNLEDALLQLYIMESEAKAKKIKRSVKDMIAEANRYKRENRNIQKKTEEIRSSSLMLDKEGKPLIINWFGDLAFNYCVDSGRWMIVLENLIKRGGTIDKKVEKALDISFGYDPIHLWKKRFIRSQIAAQIRRYEYPLASTEEIKHMLLVDPILYDYLEYDKLTSTENPQSRHRNFENRISPANSRRKKKGRPAKTDVAISKITPLPLVYNEEKKKLNGKALYEAIIAITTILKLKGKECAEIITHPVTMCYKSYAESISFFIDCWIKELFSLT